MRRFTWLVLVLSFGLADGTVPAAAQSRPNGNGTLPPVIGSQLPPGGSATSRRNIFGGQDYTLPGGERITTRRNIFGGQDITLPNGQRVTSRPNILGGYDYSLPGNGSATSRGNIFGGADYRRNR